MEAEDFSNSGYESGYEPDCSPLDLLADNDFVVGKEIYASTSGFCRLHLARRRGRLFILKSLLPEFRHDRTALMALEKEFDISFRIIGPDVARAVDKTDIRELGPCIVLDYFPGKSLEETLREEELLSSAEILEIVTRIGEALKRLHSVGIIHRDVKPSNIIYDKTAKSVVLIDFGLADSFDSTLFKGRAGTRRYMRSEMANTPGADFYALGVTLHQLLEACNDRKHLRKLKKLEKLLSRGEWQEERRHNSHKGQFLWGAFCLGIAGGLILLISLLSKKEEQTIPPAPDKDTNIATHIEGVSIGNEIPNLEKEFELVKEEDKTDNPSGKNDGSENNINNPSSTPTHSPTEIAIVTQNDNPLPNIQPVVSSSEINNPDAQKKKLDLKDPDNLDEVNFRGSNDPMLKKVKDLTGSLDFYLAAQENKIRKEYSDQPEKIDSLLRALYDENAFVARVRKKMEPIPDSWKDPSDPHRLERLIRKRYQTLYKSTPWVKKK